jgi:taurine dioxygenase
MKTVRITPAVGAEVVGVDVKTLDESTFAQLRRAFDEHGVLFFRDQNLSPNDHIAFAQRWGTININRFFKPVDGYPQIAQVLKEPEQTKNIGGGWHTDHSYDVAPAMCSILYALEIPEYGGDTLFAGMGAAYDALSDGFKRMLESLHAVHSSSHVFGKEALYLRDMGGRIGNSQAVTPDVRHPVIIRHPNTGRRLLYVNPGFTRAIDGWAQDESDQLLQFLYRHAMKPEFQARLKWQKGTLAMWDNRSTWHYALNDYHGQRRSMHRITVEGVALS